jgi:hypothetical protein
MYLLVRSTCEVGLESLDLSPLFSFFFLQGHDLKDHELSSNMGRDTICNFCNVSHANWAWDSATMMAKCYRVCNPLTPNIEPAVALMEAAPNIEPVVALVEATPNAVTGR